MSILFPVSKGWMVGVRSKETGGESKFSVQKAGRLVTEVRRQEERQGASTLQLKISSVFRTCYCMTLFLNVSSSLSNGMNVLVKCSSIIC